MFHDILIGSGPGILKLAYYNFQTTGFWTFNLCTRETSCTADQHLHDNRALSPYNWVVFHPLYTANNQGFGFCSIVNAYIIPRTIAFFWRKNSLGFVNRPEIRGVIHHKQLSTS